jgi:O-methyltransferase involved in polyketide biosynthesis
MPDKQTPASDDTAVRTALWRALHLEVDPRPHVFRDDVGLRLAAPDEGWRDRPDLSPFTRPFRASVLARARFVEDLVEEQAARGVEQGGSGWRRPASIRRGLRSWHRPVSACI